MNKLEWLVFFVILLVIQSCNNKPEITPILFEVRSKMNVVYIFGSSHNANESIYPLPNYVMDRFNNSKKLIFEIDPNSIDTLNYNSAFYEGSDDISNHISNETYNLLISYCRETGVQLENLSKIKPFDLAYGIQDKELAKADINISQGIEAYFGNVVKNKEIKIGGFESSEESLIRITLIDSADLDRYLYNTLKNKDKLVPNMIKMLRWWKTGNMEESAEFLYEEIREYESIKRILIQEREKIMVNKIEKFLSETEPVFVVVGFGHLIMENSIIDVLVSKNYQVTLIQSDN